MRVTNMLLISLLCLGTPAPGQTSRERAVGIDRVTMTPSDNLEVERIGPALLAPWSIAFLPDGSMLITEKHGAVRHMHRSGEASGPLPGGPPNVLRQSDSGLLDIVLDPDFATNSQVYIAFVEGTEDANRTAIWKARFDGAGFTGGRVIFHVSAPKKGVNHPGGRLLFLPDETLLLTVGEGFDFKEKAQDPASHLGKVLRLTREGAAAPDNPFVGRPGYAPEIWTMGNRNMQGLTRDPVTGTVWSHEHGPRGGDEINMLEAGRNYGWPITTNGIDYDGKLISERAHAPGITSPRLVWAPSIAPSGLAMYHGPLFPDFEGKLLVGALAAKCMVEVRIGKDSGLLVEEARLLTGFKQRIRDIRVASDGNIYFLTDDEENGGLYRIVPANEVLAAPRPGHDHSAGDLSFLLGSWTGTSEIRPLDNPSNLVRENSEMLCRPALRGTYVECSVTFTRHGGARTIIKYFSYNRETRQFAERILHSNWGGVTDYPFVWDAAANAYVGFIPAKAPDGGPATERVTIRPSADRQSIDHQEATRVGSSSEWVETFRWNLAKQ